MIGVPGNLEFVDFEFVGGESGSQRETLTKRSVASVSSPLVGAKGGLEYSDCVATHFLAPDEPVYLRFVVPRETDENKKKNFTAPL